MYDDPRNELLSILKLTYFYRTSVKVPTACAQFPYEIMEQSARVLRTRFVNLVRVTKMPRGGHFAAFEEPELLANDIWASVDEMEAWNKKHNKDL